MQRDPRYLVGRCSALAPAPQAHPPPEGGPAGAGGTFMLGMMRRKRKTMSTFTSRVMSHSDSRPSVAGFLQRHTDTGWPARRRQGSAWSRDSDAERATRGARKSPHRRRRPEELHGDGRAEPEPPTPATQGAHSNTSQGTAPHVVQGYMTLSPTGEPWGSRRPAPVPAELAETSLPLAVTLSPTCPSWALLCSHFYLNLTHSHPRCTPHHLPPEAPCGFSLRVRNTESWPHSRQAGPEAPLPPPPSSSTQTPPETPRGRTHPAHPRQTTPNRSTKTKAAQPTDLRPGPPEGTRSASEFTRAAVLWAARPQGCHTPRRKAPWDPWPNVHTSV